MSNHFENIPINTPTGVSNIQWRAQQALEQVYPVRKIHPRPAVPVQSALAVTPGTPIHKFDDAVGVNLPTQASAAVPAKPTPIHHSYAVYEWGCAIALALGISLAVTDFLIKLRLNKMRKLVFHGSSQGHALPVVDNTTPYPWEDNERL